MSADLMLGNADSRHVDALHPSPNIEPRRDASASLLILHLLRKHRDEPLMTLSLALILGGAAGNIFDRAWHGFVVDFLYFHYQTYAFPAFNAADSAITVGAGLLIYDSLRRKKT